MGELFIMKKLAIYPYNIRFTWLCRSIVEGWNLEYEDVQLFAPVSHGLEGKDASALDGGVPIKRVVHSLINVINSNDIDEIIIDYDERIPLQDYIKIVKVFCSYIQVCFTKAMFFKYKDLLPENGKVLLNSEYAAIKTADKCQLMEMPVPVIFVLGIDDWCGKNLLALQLREKFSRETYRAVVVSNMSFGETCGCVRFPNVLFDNIDPSKKIVSLNQWMYNLANKEKPDVVIIDIPGGIMKLNPYNFSEWGEYAYLIAMSIRADLGLLCLPANYLTTEYLAHLESICLYKYNISLLAFGMSNVVLSLDHDTRELIHITLPYSHTKKFIDDYRKAVDNPKIIFSISDKREVNELTQKMIKTMEQDFR